MTHHWRDALPSRAARAYVAAVTVAGATGLVLYFPASLPRPGLFAVLLLLTCLTSVWKVNLPIPLANGSTLSVSYAADLMALLLLGSRQAMLIAVVGAWAQCTVTIKRPYPLYRTVFSVAAEAGTMLTTGFVYGGLGGPDVSSGSYGPFELAALARPLTGAIVTYFLVNTGLVAGAIGLSTGRSPVTVWREEFLWSGASFFVAGSAGAIAAVVVARGDWWLAALMIAPVYLTYWTYQVFVGRLEDQRLHREHLAAALADMTRLKELRHQLLEREQIARSSAEQANRLKDEFLGIVSHELRTPLNAILGWSDMLRAGGPVSLDESRRARAVQAIHESAKRQAQLIDELLDVSRIISGRLRLERSAVDWREIIRSALEVAQPAADAKHIELLVDVDEDIPFSGDAARLQQIAWNLLINAVKFTPDGGVVHVHLARHRQIAELSVTDTGEGIPPDFLPSVFEPFRQADGSMTRRHGGLGLGLSIVRHLAEAHGGTVHAASGGEGRGSTFTVRLPITPVYGEAPAADEGSSLATAATAATTPTPSRLTPAPLAPSTSLDGIRVLVVDDDDGSREVVAAYLEARHAAVLGAASAHDAIEILRHQPVDVLLADIAMPGQDGYELIRAVRAMDEPETSRIPAAALTAFARADDRRKALDAGFQLHLTKPIGASSLIEAVANLSRIRTSARH